VRGGGFKEGKSRRACYGFDSASLRRGDGQWGRRRQPDLVTVRSDSGDAGGG
jgi:hypothetical protein